MENADQYEERSPAIARPSLSHALAQSEGQFRVGSKETLSEEEGSFAWSARMINKHAREGQDVMKQS